jgi:alcohol dehydrogenase (cytochrome c)
MLHSVVQISLDSPTRQVGRGDDARAGGAELGLVLCDGDRSIRPGSDLRADSLIAVDLRTGRMRWWQQQMAHNEWSYDTAQPPLVYTAKVGGKKQRVVSVATMEGAWFAYDAATGRPIYQRIKVIDHTEHPTLQPGKPVAVYPSSLGGLNYSLSMANQG